MRGLQQPDGSLNIFVGNGQGLVIGGQTTKLEVRPNAYDASKVEIGLEGQLPGTNIFMVTRYSDIKKILKDTATFSNNFTEQLKGPEPAPGKGKDAAKPATP